MVIIRAWMNVELLLVRPLIASISILGQSSQYNDNLHSFLIFCWHHAATRLHEAKITNNRIRQWNSSQAFYTSTVTLWKLAMSKIVIFNCKEGMPKGGLVTDVKVVILVGAVESLPFQGELVLMLVGYFNLALHYTQKEASYVWAKLGYWSLLSFFLIGKHGWGLPNMSWAKPLLTNNQCTD